MLSTMMTGHLLEHRMDAFYTSADAGVPLR